jgi:hypothetical protein
MQDGLIALEELASETAPRAVPVGGIREHLCNRQRRESERHNKNEKLFHGFSSLVNNVAAGLAAGRV